MTWENEPLFVDSEPYLSPESVLAVLSPDWRDVLNPVIPDIEMLLARVFSERKAGTTILPTNILKAFSRPFNDVKVLIIGQDPYHTIGVATGLAFSVNRETRKLPPSLKNIYRELSDDLGCPPPPHGDLSSWFTQGVLLLNRVLTVTAGSANSHQSYGWQRITEYAVCALAARNLPLVSILWGSEAQKLAPLLNNYPMITSAHPSPLSAYRGFFGSKPFSKTNAMLTAQGATPIDWEIK